MNYIKQLNAFWNWVRTNEISHLEADLYLSILDIANASSWKTRFTIPNSTLGRFDKNSLVRARNKLVQYGLIRYEKGKKGQAPTYSVKKLFIESEMNPNNDTKNDTKNDTNEIMNPNNDTYIDTNNDTNMQPIQGIYLNKKENKTKDINPHTPYLQIIDLYHEICTSYPKLLKISDARKRAIATRSKKYTLEDFGELFRKAQASSFLKGENKKGWSANFDWLINEANMVKVLEGNYDDRQSTEPESNGYCDLETLTRMRM